ncbi:hypothetical protein C2134_16650 [Chromobacterium sinusclupearum]|uniref:Uncharacterized protein n=1 Tax=Chromobacterium sinusclupearum TaxID=2077146 RepID=A0A2K4MK34_9NEIS|nr:hypothetical protein C2134_16650 [Chromobacterium sinusclupearum]
MTHFYPSSFASAFALCTLLALLLERALALLLPRSHSSLPWFELCCLCCAYPLSQLLRIAPAAALQPVLLPHAADAGLTALGIIALAGLLRHARSNKSQAAPKQERRVFRLGSLTTSPYPLRPERRK